MAGEPEMELLRFTTAGSVDDGKSTLIGRLLYDSKTIFEDQLEHVEDVSKRRGNEPHDATRRRHPPQHLIRPGDFKHKPATHEHLHIHG